MIIPLSLSATILDRLLVKENLLAIRKLGYEMMLKFLEDLENADPPYLQYIATGVDLTPFLTLSHVNVVLPYKPLSGNGSISDSHSAAQDPNTILAPSYATNSIQESVELLDLYFEFMNQQ